jgi:ABC-type dipeptide/oligopeptide/nickel transport system permease component
LASKFRTHFVSFVLFFLVLSAVSAFLTAFRTQNKNFQYADISLSNVVTPQNVWKDFLKRYKENLLLEFGKTLTNENVTQHILHRLFPTLELALASVVFGGGLGIFLGMFSFYIHSEKFLKFFRFEYLNI